MSLGDQSESQGNGMTLTYIDLLLFLRTFRNFTGETFHLFTTRRIISTRWDYGLSTTYQGRTFEREVFNYITSVAPNLVRCRLSESLDGGVIIIIDWTLVPHKTM